MKSFHFLFETADDMFCVVNDENSWVLSEKLLWDFPLTLIDSAQVVECLPPINQLALDFKTPDDAWAAAEKLNRKFGEHIYAQKGQTVFDAGLQAFYAEQMIDDIVSAYAVYRKKRKTRNKEGDACDRYRFFSVHDAIILSYLLHSSKPYLRSGLFLSFRIRSPSGSGLPLKGPRT